MDEIKVQEKNTLLKICDTAYDLLYVVKGNSKFYESMGYAL